MTFLSPGFLWLCIPLTFLLWRSAPKVHERIPLIILILLALSLARPSQHSVLQTVTIEAKDIIIALDVSYSMQAKDIHPTRYNFAKETIRALLKKNPTDNIMLMVFTSHPLLLSPPTTDHMLIALALKSLSPQYILTKGTSLKNLFIRLSTMHLENTHLILITDGGEETQPESLTNLLQKTGLSLHILALGTNKGTTIENKDTSLVKDKKGQLVISRINPILKQLAIALEGTYTLAQHSAQETANTLYTALQSKHSKTHKIHKMDYRYTEFYHIPLFFALILFIMLHTRAIKYLLVFFGLIGLPLQASFLEGYYLHQAYASYQKQDYSNTLHHLQQLNVPSLQSQWIRANTYFKLGQYKQAIQVYSTIRTTSVPYKQQLYYNIATAHSKLKAYDKAKIYYTKTLQLGQDDDALHNLKVIMFLKQKKHLSLGIAHPKSQNSDSTSSESMKKENDPMRKEDQPSTGSGAGGKKSSKEKKERHKSKLLLDPNYKKHPLGSKVYELINKGYIREKRPW